MGGATERVGEALPGAQGGSGALKRMARSVAVLMEGNMNMQKTAPEEFQRQIFKEKKRAGGAEDKRRAGTRTKEAQVDKMGR